MNIIKWIKRKAKEGLVLIKESFATSEYIWYDEETYYGEDVKKLLNYKDYKDELKRRYGKKE